MLIQINSADRRLLEDVSAAMAEAARLSGAWLVCHPGCTQCCLGPFGITRLDELRLRDGLQVLDSTDPAHAAQIRSRARAYIARIAPQYPGDLRTGELLDQDALPGFMDDEPCPALDLHTGLCGLYEWRPVTCRLFGPVQEVGQGVYGACELCYSGATEADSARCCVDPDPDGREAAILDTLAADGIGGLTTVAFALADDNAASQSAGSRSKPIRWRPMPVAPPVPQAARCDAEYRQG